MQWFHDIGRQNDPAVFSDRLGKHGVVLRRFNHQDIKADDFGLVETIQESCIVASPQGPPTQSVKGAFVHCNDQDAVVVDRGAPQSEEKIVAVVVHPHEKTQYVHHQDQGETDKKDEKIFSLFCKRVAQIHIYQP